MRSEYFIKMTVFYSMTPQKKEYKKCSVWKRPGLVLSYQNQKMFTSKYNITF